MKVLTIAVTTTFLFTLAACDRLGLGTQEAGNAANAADANASGDKPGADAAGNTAEGGKDPQAGSAQGAAGLTMAAIAGRWTDNNDCNQVTLLADDGTFVAPNGGRGNWTIDGTQLTLSGPGGTANFTVALSDPNTMQLISAEGQASQSTRC
ncbi:MAG: hypothetical protein ACT4OE_01670 [Sphingosinicella sp.]